MVYLLLMIIALLLLAGLATMFITTFSGRFVRKAAATTLLVVSALIIFQFVKPAVSSEAGPRGYHGFIKRYGTKLADEKCQEFYVNGWNS